MKLTVVLILLAQLAAQSSRQQPQTAEKASIEGMVLRAVSGEPLPRAEIQLTHVPSDEEQRTSKFFNPEEGREGLPAVLTQNDGKFFIPDLEPGQYRLSVSCNGYVDQVYGRKNTFGQGAIISLAPGEKLRNLTFRLVPAGVITGRVRDTSGRPVTGFEVMLLKLSFDGGRQSLVPAADGVPTDDRGEYRHYWVPPGRYYIRVRRSAGRFASGRIVTDKTLSAAFYPGVADPSSASVIDLAPGAEVGAVDIVLPPLSGYRIRGRLVEASTGKPPKSAEVHVRPKKATIFEESDDSESAQYNSKTGEFEIRNVVPGSYSLMATSSTDFKEPIPPERLAEIRTGADIFQAMFGSPVSAAQISIDMNAADLNDVVLVLSGGVTIPVRLRVEGADVTSLRGAEDIRVQLFSEALAMQPRQSTRLDADGVGRIDNVITGQYSVWLDHPPSENLYVKEILYGRSDVLNAPADVTNQPAAISVLLSTKGGQIEGHLTNALSQPVGGAEVVLIPDDRERFPLYKTANTDREGRFIFRALPPGGYKAFSWEDLGENDYHDSRVLSKYETQGRPVRIQESAKEAVNLRIIPAPQQ